MAVPARKTKHISAMAARCVGMLFSRRYPKAGPNIPTAVKSLRMRSLGPPRRYAASARTPTAGKERNITK